MFEPTDTSIVFMILLKLLGIKRSQTGSKQLFGKDYINFRICRVLWIMKRYVSNY